MRNRHLLPLLTLLFSMVAISLLVVTEITYSKFFVTTVVVVIFWANVFEARINKSLSNHRVIELGILFLLAEYAALSLI